MRGKELYKHKEKIEEEEQEELKNWRIEEEELENWRRRRRRITGRWT